MGVEVSEVRTIPVGGIVYVPFSDWKGRIYPVRIKCACSLESEVQEVLCDLPSDLRRADVARHTCHRCEVTSWVEVFFYDPVPLIEMSIGENYFNFELQKYDIYAYIQCDGNGCGGRSRVSCIPAKTFGEGLLESRCLACDRPLFARVGLYI